jgi:hypothetical protein
MDVSMTCISQDLIYNCCCHLLVFHSHKHKQADLACRYISMVPDIIIIFTSENKYCYLSIVANACSGFKSWPYVTRQNVSRPPSIMNNILHVFANLFELCTVTFDLNNSKYV